MNCPCTRTGSDRVTVHLGVGKWLVPRTPCAVPCCFALGLTPVTPRPVLALRVEVPVAVDLVLLPVVLAAVLPVVVRVAAGRVVVVLTGLIECFPIRRSCAVGEGIDRSRLRQIDRDEPILLHDAHASRPRNEKKQGANRISVFIPLRISSVWSVVSQKSARSSRLRAHPLSVRRRKFDPRRFRQLSVRCKC